jgi:hypothetical protein
VHHLLKYSISEAREILKNAVGRHEEILYEKKRRAFSPKYLNLKIDEQINPNQMPEILQKSTAFKNKTVADLIDKVALTDECRCCKEITTTQPGHP